MQPVNDRARLALIDFVTKAIAAEDDPRVPETLKRLHAQREEVVKRIQASQPPAQVVGARAAQLKVRRG